MVTLNRVIRIVKHTYYILYFKSHFNNTPYYSEYELTKVNVLNMTAVHCRHTCTVGILFSKLSK